MSGLTLSSSDLAALQSAAGTLLGQIQGAGSNPLDKFQTFNSLFTLACLTRKQQNSGNFDRGQIENVIARSQGDWGDGNKRVGTDFGSFDYFIDDVTIVSIAAPSEETGNTFATKVSFKVIEPYSMGLFLLTMQQAAEKAGYNLNFKEAPYILMVEFVGHINNQPSSSTPSKDLTRYIPIKIISMKFNVGSSGSTYEVEAVPYNEHAFRDHIVKSVTDIQISGTTVKEILADGPTSLLSQLETKHLNEKADKNIDNTDIILIQFPQTFDQAVGSDNDISKATLYHNNESGGTQPFKELNEITIDGKHITKSSAYRMEDNKTWHFVQEVTIPDIITEVVVRSDYIVNQIVGTQFRTDSNGMVNWFRIETRIQDLSNNPQLGRQQRMIVYRVVPYKVHVHRFLPPDAIPPGYDNLRKTVARTYDYIYTGRNTEILKVDLNFDMAFFTPIPADAGERVGQNTPGQGSITAGGQEIISEAPPTAGSDSNGTGGAFAYQSPSPLVQMQGGQSTNTLLNLKNQNYSPQNPLTSNRPEIKSTTVPTASREFFYKAPGGAGADNEQTSQVRTLNHLLTNNADMIQLTMDIMGDPYYLPSSGMGNQSRSRVSSNLLDDGSMNYQESEVDIILNFRTPIDIDLTTGLYKFEKAIDMWSGLYQVIEVESKFNGGKFIQTVRGNRLRTQYGGTQKADSIFLKEKGRTGGDANSAGGGGAGSSALGGGGDGGFPNEPANSYNPDIPNTSSGAGDVGIPQSPSSSPYTDFGGNFF